LTRGGVSGANRITGVKKQSCPNKKGGLGEKKG